MDAQRSTLPAPGTGFDPHQPPAALSTRAFLLGLGALLVVFVSLNPIWQKQSVQAWDQNVWWSYAPIPLVVAALLAWERKLSAAGVLLESMRLGLVKFAITFALAHAVWAVQGPPALPEVPVVALPRKSGAGLHGVQVAPAPSALDQAASASLSGQVLDQPGLPVADALVWISAGLEGLQFAPPPEPVVLVNSGMGFVPDRSTVAAFGQLLLRSEDDVLHTAVFREPDGRFLLNHPVLPGPGRALMFGRGHGLLELDCSVHAGQETPVTVLVSDHPFAARTGADGRFAFSGLPARALKLSLLDDARRLTTRSLSLAPGQHLQLTLDD